ncbi:MAG: hypothetical protein GYA24_07420 [Candidatus Lokiarchaeota archaeon]|nr:hypothetical protein [Candidatus Lokiarchaeota archaeon]
MSRTKQAKRDSFEARQQARLHEIDATILDHERSLARLARSPAHALERRCHACRSLVDHVEDHDRFMRFDCPDHGPVLSYVDKRVLDPRGETMSVFKARDSAAAGLRQAIAGSTARRAAIASSGRLF